MGKMSSSYYIEQKPFIEASGFRDVSSQTK